MPYTPRSRDAYGALAASITGLATVAAMGGTGVLTGLAAEQMAQDEAEKSEQRRPSADQQPAAGPVRVVRRPRPERTVVTTRVVYRSSGSGTAAVGGGSLSSSRTSSGVSSASGGGSGTSGGPGTSGPEPAPAPAPQPAPAPSSGS